MNINKEAVDQEISSLEERIKQLNVMLLKMMGAKEVLEQLHKLEAKDESVPVKPDSPD